MGNLRHNGAMSGTASTAQAPPVNRDEDAGHFLKELREALYIPRDALPQEMRRKGVPRTLIPTCKTVYNVEERGQIPIERYRFGLAQFYGRSVADIWPVTRRARPAAA